MTMTLPAGRTGATAINSPANSPKEAPSTLIIFKQSLRSFV
jgi:hypothetical protein